MTGEHHQCGAAPDSDSLELTGERPQIERAVARVLQAVARQGYPEASRFALRLAMEEAISNALRHGHRDLPRHVPVRFQYAVEPGQVEVLVEDRGPGFDPASVPDPTLDENLENPSGRGLMLMRAYMTRVRFEEGGRRVRMTYRRPSGR